MDSMKQLEQSVVDQAGRLNYTIQTVQEVKEKVKTMLLDKWDEQLIFERRRGVQLSQLDPYLRSITDLLTGLEKNDVNKILSGIRSAKFSDDGDTAINHFNYDDKNPQLGYKRGFVAFNKEGSEKLNIIISVYWLKMNIGGQLRQETVPQYAFYFIPWGTEEKTRVGKLDPNDTNVMKEIYCVYKAFQAMPINALRSIDWLRD